MYRMGLHWLLRNVDTHGVSPIGLCYLVVFVLWVGLVCWDGWGICWCFAIGLKIGGSVMVDGLVVLCLLVTGVGDALRHPPLYGVYPSIIA